MTSLPILRPQRMLRAGRQPNQQFNPEEKLYRRCTKDEIKGTHLEPAKISFRDWSVNRHGEDGEPADVLIPTPEDAASGKDYTGWGVVSFQVKDIPTGFQGASGSHFEFRPEHVPLEFNFAHSEIRTFKNNTHDNKYSFSKTDKIKAKALKENLSRTTFIEIEPTV